MKYSSTQLLVVGKTILLAGFSNAAVSTFSLGNLSGPVGTGGGVLNVPNANAPGGNLQVTVTSSVVSSSNNFHGSYGTTGQGGQTATAPNFGFIFGASTNSSSAAGNSATTLTNFVQIKLAFSTPILLNDLTIRDIDRTSASNDNGFIDTVWVEAQNSTVPVPVTYSTNPGTGLQAIPWAGTIAYRAATGSFANTGVGNPQAHLITNTSALVDCVIVYVNNSAGNPNFGDHGVDLGSEITVDVVPEPSSALLLAFSAAFCLRRKR